MHKSRGLEISARGAAGLRGRGPTVHVTRLVHVLDERVGLPARAAAANAGAFAAGLGAVEAHGLDKEACALRNAEDVVAVVHHAFVRLVALADARRRLGHGAAGQVGGVNAAARGVELSSALLPTLGLWWQSATSSRA